MTFLNLQLPLVRGAVLFMVVAATMLVIAGCRGAGRSEADARGDDTPAAVRWQIERPAPTTAEVDRRPLAITAKPMLLAQGELPLVYLLPAAGTISVADLSAGAQLVSNVSAPGNTIIRIDPARGVIFGEDHLVPGPLPEDRTYGIYLAPPGENSIETRTISPSLEPRRANPAIERDQPAPPPTGTPPENGS